MDCGACENGDDGSDNLEEEGSDELGIVIERGGLGLESFLYTNFSLSSLMSTKQASSPRRLAHREALTQVFSTSSSASIIRLILILVSKDLSASSEERA